MHTGIPNSPSVEESDRHSIQVIERAASILRTLQKSSGGLSLGEIAKAVPLPRSTVQRIVDALANERMVIATSQNHGVRLGPALIGLGKAIRFPVAEVARPILEALAKKTWETVDLSIFSRDKMVFVDQIAGNHRLAAVSATGVPFPLHCSANGKAALAQLSDEQLHKVRKHLTLERYTSNTLTSWDELQGQLTEIRKTGLSFDREEHSLGICAVGSALRMPDGEIIAISIPVPALRFSSNELALCSALQSSVKAVQKRLTSTWPA